jgi:hypothetical protein
MELVFCRKALLQTTRANFAQASPLTMQKASEFETEVQSGVTFTTNDLRRQTRNALLKLGLDLERVASLANAGEKT